MKSSEIARIIAIVFCFAVALFTHNWFAAIGFFLAAMYATALYVEVKNAR